MVVWQPRLRLVIVAALGGALWPVLAQESPGRGGVKEPAPVAAGDIRGIYEQARKSVVLLVTLDEELEPHALGSGVIWSSEGEIITNLHVVRGAETVAVKLWNGPLLFIEGVVAFDPSLDLAILKADARELTAAQLRESGDLEIGETVLAIGNPLGLEGSLSAGIVAGLRGTAGTPDLIQTTVPISEGSSGGGLFDSDGRLVGITTSSMKGGQSLNFAVPAVKAKTMRRFDSLLAVAELPEENSPEESAAGDIEKLVAEAERFTSLEMYQDAAEVLAEARSADPYHPVVRYLLGRVAFGRGDYAAAEAEFKICLNLEPTSVSPLFQMAITYVARFDKVPEAREEIARLLQAYQERRKSVEADRFSDAEVVSNMDSIVRDLWEGLRDVTGYWSYLGPRVVLLKEEDGLITWTEPSNGRDLMFTQGTLRRTQDDVVEGQMQTMLRDGCTWTDALSLRESPDGATLSGHWTLVRRGRKGICPELTKPGARGDVEMHRVQR